MADIDRATEETTEVIAIGERPTDAFVVRPRGSGPYPAVLVLHDEGGVDEQARSHGRKLAREGYVAVVPQLRGEVDRGRGSALDLGRDVVAAIGYAQSLGRGGEQVGLIGFGSGGFAAFLGACLGRRANVTAAVVVYGSSIGRICRNVGAVRDSTTRAAAPVRCILGAEDAMADARELGAVRTLFTKYRVPHEILVYPRAGHGFLDETGPAYRPVVAADAWQRTLEWLRVTRGARRPGRPRRSFPR
jgi:carboxymethylenebutenolidase